MWICWSSVCNLKDTNLSPSNFNKRDFYLVCEMSGKKHVLLGKGETFKCLFLSKLQRLLQNFHLLSNGRAVFTSKISFQNKTTFLFNFCWVADQCNNVCCIIYISPQFIFKSSVWASCILFQPQILFRDAPNLFCMSHTLNTTTNNNIIAALS